MSIHRVSRYKVKELAQFDSRAHAAIHDQSPATLLLTSLDSSFTLTDRVLG